MTLSLSKSCMLAQNDFFTTMILYSPDIAIYDMDSLMQCICHLILNRSTAVLFFITIKYLSN